MFVLTGYINFYTDKFSNRTRERFIYRSFDSKEEAAKELKRMEEEYPQTDLVVQAKEK